MTIIIVFSFLLAVLTVLHAYAKKHISPVFLMPVKLFLKVFFPVVAFSADVLKGDRDAVRRIFVEINNLLVEAAGEKYGPDEVLILLPHCLQYSECGHKITTSIYNCRECGKCAISEIAGIARRLGVEAKVVTGGTAARNTVRRSRPRMILSVACERDLTSGIADVGVIPVMGIVNRRPNGPCYNTSVDIKVFEERLKNLLKTGGM